jgi:pimeloyl-ACP methyl ester carboxylesterase
VARFLLTSRVGGEELVGTLHARETERPRRIGVLLLNAGPAPRAGNSDLSVHLGERLSAAGFLCARFDLVGLGDSSGAAPATLAEYWNEVLAGRNDTAVAALVHDLHARLAVDGLVVGGLCAGAVSAIRAAHAVPEGIAGLILLETNFRMVPTARAEDVDDAPAQALTSQLARVMSLREWLYWMTGESRWAGFLRPLHPLLERVLGRLVGHTLPRDANVPLVMQWRHLLERRLPSLVVTSQSHLSARYYRRIVSSLPPECAPAVEATSIPGTNHILTTGDARRLVCDAVERWMTSRFSAESVRSAPPRGQPSPAVLTCSAP